jgi:hypothetical protein
MKATYSRAVTFSRPLLALSLSAVAMAAGPAVAQAKTETDSQGAVSASFSYTANKDKTQFKNLKVEIKRGGATVLTTTLPKYKDFWPGGVVDNSSIEVRDLDADAEPEVIVKLYSGGANCCLSALFYRYQAASNTYTPTYGDFGRYGYGLRNLDKKGPVEIVATDVRFQGAFGLPTVATVSPLRIFRLTNGKLVDVTRAFPAEVKKNLKILRSDYRSFVKAKASRKGILAAIAADQISLNDANGTARTLGKVDTLYGREFGKRLRSFLGRRGYRLR